MSMNLYRHNLQKSTTALAKASNTVQTQRNFNSYAEDPSSATQAWRVRRAMVNTDSYLKNNKDTYTRFSIAWVTLDAVSDRLTDKDGRMSDLRATNDPTGSGRNALGQVLRQTAESAIQAMNGAKSGEHFIFSGDDELNAPFTWEDGDLCYRGVNVNSGKFMSPDAPDPVPDQWGEINPETGWPEKMPNKVDKDDVVTQAWVDYYKAKATDDTATPPTFGTNPIVATPADDYGTPKEAFNILNEVDEDGNPKNDYTDDQKAWAAYLVDQGEYKKLQAMSKEQAPIDLGMGLLQNDNGDLIEGTYYDRALPGINMLGFGYDEDGDPKNVCMIMARLGEIFENCHPDSGSYDKDDSSGTSKTASAIRSEAMRLLDKLNAGKDYIDGQYVEVNAKSSFLQQNEDRLNMQAAYLDEQRAELEDVNMADAITQFSYQYYCYSAGLKIGTQLLSQSLIDYMS